MNRDTVEGLVTDEIGGLPPIISVPVTEFVNRAGSVHEVYTGFSGPPTGTAYQTPPQFYTR
jgi:hypothetical protein